MKIGSFVGRENLPLSISDIHFIENIIYNSDVVKNNNLSVEMKTTEFGVRWELRGFPNVTKRDMHGNTFRPKYVVVRVSKNKGYDEKIYGRFYEWKDGFEAPHDLTSYDCGVDLIGDYRRYRGKNVEHNVGITKTNYSYGTELSDLTITEGLDKVGMYVESTTTKLKIS